MANEKLINNNKDKNELDVIRKVINELRTEFQQLKKTLNEVLEVVKAIRRDM